MAILKVLNVNYLCEQTLAYKASLKAHVLAKHGESKHKCDFCNKNFSMEADLEKHISRVHAKKSIDCVQCENLFHVITNSDYNR